MSKKRKEPPQSNTLLHFFSAGTNGTSSIDSIKKRENSDAVKQQTDSRLPCSGTKVGKDPEDGGWEAGGIPVIVIESDEEEDMVVRLGDASSDVEIITDARPYKTQKVVTDYGLSGEDTFENDVPSARGNALPGEPSAEDHASKGDEPIAKADLDEWDLAMGDEELDAEFISNEFEQDDSCGDFVMRRGVREKRIDDDNVTDSCPVCSATFLDTEPADIQTHVNRCLDALSSGGYPSPVVRKPLRPLSSFPVSSGSTPSTFNSKPDLKPKATSAFSILMSGNAQRERAAWVEAQKAEDKGFRPTKSERRQAPFYKVLTGMPIAVDAFRYGSIPGVEAYFLTHAHSDHYTNLSSNWKNGPIYCSETTANLIAHMLSVDKKWLHPLPMNAPVEIPKTGGVKVTLIDANHCPGSCLFLFEGLQTINAGDTTYKSPFIGTSRIFRYLHCGDFRASPQHVMHPAVKGKRLDIVYLDTTYLNPKYCFPPQPLVVSACAELARRIVKDESLNGECERNGVSGRRSIQGWMKVGQGKVKQKEQGNGNVLVVVGTYSIGKERVVKAIAKALNTKIYCDARKKTILLCQDDPELHSLLTDKPLEAGVHVVPLGTVASDRFKEYMGRWKGRWSRAVAFRPTGWTYTPPAGSDPSPSISRIVSSAQSREFTFTNLQPSRNSTPQLMQYGVPYSEHSSFTELACFVLSVNCVRVIATVNVGSAGARAKMQSWVEKWEVERKRRKEVGLPDVVEYRNLEYW